MERIPGKNTAKGSLMPHIPFFIWLAAPWVLELAGLNLITGYIDKYPVILFVYIIGCVVLVLLPVVFIVMRIAKKEAAVRMLRSSGLAADAEIIGIEKTGTNITVGNDEQLGVLLELKINPQGGKQYIASAEHYVSIIDIPRFQPGCTIQVKINPADIMDVAVDE